MPKNVRRSIGFDHPAECAATAKYRPLLTIEFITSAALALSTLIAATAVSIGIARADTPAPAMDEGSMALSAAILFGLMFSGMAALAAIMAGKRRQNA